MHKLRNQIIWYQLHQLDYIFKRPPVYPGSAKSIYIINILCRGRHSLNYFLNLLVYNFDKYGTIFSSTLKFQSISIFNYISSIYSDCLHAATWPKFLFSESNCPALSKTVQLCHGSNTSGNVSKYVFIFTCALI